MAVVYGGKIAVTTRVRIKTMGMQKYRFIRKVFSIIKIMYQDK